MAITGIASVLFGAKDMDKAQRFYSDWGLKKVSGGKGGATFETAVGSTIVVKPEDAKSLPAPLSPDGGFREVTFGLPSQRELDALAKRLGNGSSVRRDRDGTIHTADPNGIGLAFKVWKPRAVKARRAPVNDIGKRERIDKPSVMYDRGRPLRMGHVVFQMPEIVEAEKFYRDRLGFRLSDRYADGRAVFLRYAPASDHHNMLFIKSEAGRKELHHIAFEVRDVHEVFGGGLAMSKKAWATSVGPGRHPISSAYFWYFINPCGGAFEYFADSDYVTDKWKPSVFKDSRFSEWHIPDGIGETRGPAMMAVHEEERQLDFGKPAI
jgi:catechol-2,3-dioxygenase